MHCCLQRGKKEQTMLSLVFLGRVLFFIDLDVFLINALFEYLVSQPYSCFAVCCT